jgi:hypothetical protein
MIVIGSGIVPRVCRGITYLLEEPIRLSPGRIVYLCGRNGIGKSTFVEQVLIPALAARAVPCCYLAQNILEQSYVMQAALAFRAATAAPQGEGDTVRRWLAQAAALSRTLVADEFDKLMPDPRQFFRKVAQRFQSCFLVTHHLDAAHQQAGRSVFQTGERLLLERAGDPGRIVLKKERLW